jgi:hypothetical protein
MAQTYTHTPNLSKVKLGASTYYLKDADVRAILDTFGNIVTENKATKIEDGATGIPNADQVYDFVIQQITDVGKALNLIAATDHTAVETPKIGDFVVEADGSEWLYDGHAWREVGSESAYVTKTFTIAGVDMQNNITKDELQQALELHALAYKDNGSVAITTPDGINSFSTGKAGTYSVSSTAVSVPATYDAMDVTPAGAVTLTAGTAAAASYDKTTSITVSSAAAEGAAANYTPTGSVTITNVTVTPDKVSVAKVTDAGTAYSLTDGSVAKAADTTSQFATAGVIASIDETDTEMLVFSDAIKADAVTAAGAVTYTAPVLSGALPTFGTESVVSGIASSSASASFTGDGVAIAATPVSTATAATMTQPTFSAAFEGTSKSVTPTVATTVSAAGTDGSVVVASETITPALQTSEKTVQVSFGVANN